MLDKSSRRSRRPPQLQSNQQQYRGTLGPFSLGSRNQIRFHSRRISPRTRLLFHVHMEPWKPRHVNDPRTAQLGRQPARRNRGNIEAKPSNPLFNNQRQVPGGHQSDFQIASRSLLRRSKGRRENYSVPDRDQLQVHHQRPLSYTSLDKTRTSGMELSMDSFQIG